MRSFIVFNDISIVQGAKNALLIDYRNHAFFSLEMTLGSFLKRRIIKLENISDEENELIEYLVANDYGLICEEEETARFEGINSTWDYPASISNAIVEIEKGQIHLDDLFKELTELNCEYVELRVANNVDRDCLIYVFSLLANHEIPCVELVIPYHDWVSEKFVEEINELYSIFLYKITIHSMPKSVKIPEINSTSKFNFLEKSLSCLDCGRVDFSNFKVNLPFQTEGIRFNTCLNRKLAVKANGDIRNCPSMSTNFGNIKKDNLQTIIDLPEFSSVWKISKNQINVCKDCEFRTICMDCRALVSEPSDIYSKPLKCGYDPYLGIWSDWNKDIERKSVFDSYKKKLGG